MAEDAVCWNIGKLFHMNGYHFVSTLELPIISYFTPVGSLLTGLECIGTKVLIKSRIIEGT
jgi:hypothetical protein